MELPLIDDKEMLCASLVGKYSYRRVKDVILEACKHQRDAGLLILKQMEQKHKEECDNCPSAKLYDEAYARIVELEAEIAELKKKLGHEHQKAQSYSDNAEWAESELEQFDIRQFVPEGKYCDQCKLEDTLHCNKILIQACGFAKCDTCPKPYKEQV